MKKTVKKSLALLLSLIMLWSCIGVSASAADATEKTGYEPLRISCTMYGDAKTQRGFSWFTEKACDSTIYVTKSYDIDFSDALVFEGEASEWDGYYNHKVVATGLEKGTKYIYKIGSKDNDVFADGSFVTDDGDDEFSFIAIADVQASSPENFKQAADVMRTAAATYKDSEFTINLGDFVNDCTSEEWNWYGEAFAPYNTTATLVPVAGNHEGNITNKLNVKWFDTTFNLLKGEGELNGVNGTYYSYDYGNVHFTVLNSNDMYPMTDAQRNWIYNDLTSSDAHWKVLLLHRAVYSAGKNINKPDTLAMRETIIEIVDETGVDLVLSGHDHMYFRTQQVKGDAVCEDTLYVTEKYNGKDTTFAVDPDGAVYALPSTAGTKRYSVNENPINPIMDCADACFSTRSSKDENGNETNPYAGGCFAGIEIDGDYLVYKAYVVEDRDPSKDYATKAKATLVDEYAIKKTVADEPIDDTDLPTDVIGSLDGSVANFFTEIFGLIITYIGKLLPQAIVGLFK